MPLWRGLGHSLPFIFWCAEKRSFRHLPRRLRRGSDAGIDIAMRPGRIIEATGGASGCLIDAHCCYLLLCQRLAPSRWRCEVSGREVIASTGHLARFVEAPVTSAVDHGNIGSG